MNYRISDKRLNGIINESLNDVILSEGWFGDSDEEKQRKERIQQLIANVKQIQDSVAKLEGRFETLQMNAAQGMYNQNQSANNAGNNGNAAAQTPDLKTLISAEYNV